MGLLGSLFGNSATPETAPDGRTPLAGPSVTDILAGTDRVGLNTQVANGQALNGLRTAQTQLSMDNDQKLQQELQAREGLKSKLTALYGGDPVKGEAAATALVGGFGNAQNVGEFMNLAQKNNATAQIGDPNSDAAAQARAQQMLTGKVAEPVAAPPNFIAPGNNPNPQVQQTPEGQAQTEKDKAAANASNALGGLRGVQAAAGGYNPHVAGGGLGLQLDQQQALNKAINEGRVDPLKLTSRNAPIIAQAEISNPGVNDYNKLHATANLQANAGFQQKGLVMDALPNMIENMVAAGKKLNYPDLQVAGEAKKWMMGQSNDPDLAEYMAQRNDTLMNLASVMRGVGMSDKAHDAELEAASPTLSPRALEGWARGQMTAVTPRLARMHGILDSKGAPPAGSVTPPAVDTAGPPAASGFKILGVTKAPQ